VPQFRKSHYTLLAVKFGGLSYLLAEFRRRLYRRETFIGLARNLEEPDSEVTCRIPYSLHLASGSDIQEMVDLLQFEGKDSIFDLLQRKWFYDSGFRNCYVARTLEGNQICYVQWTISTQDSNAGSSDFSASFPRLKDHEMQLEHAYTFKAFRGFNLMPAVMNDLFRIAREKGYPRVITYVQAENVASQKGCFKVGFQVFELVHRRKLFLFNRSEIIPLAWPENRNLAPAGPRIIE